MEDNEIEIQLAVETDKQTSKRTKSAEEKNSIEKREKIVEIQNQNINDAEKNTKAQRKIKNKKLEVHGKEHQSDFKSYEEIIEQLKTCIAELRKDTKKGTDKEEVNIFDIYWNYFNDEEKKNIKAAIHRFKNNIDKKIKQLNECKRDLLQTIHHEEENIKSLKQEVSFYKKAKKGKENHALVTIGGAMMIVALILMAWNSLLLKSGTCEKEKALASLNLNYTFQCEDEGVKKRIESIFQLGFVSAVSDFLFLFFGILLWRLPKKLRISGLKCLYLYTAIEAFAFALPLLTSYTEMADLKTKDTDYLEVKKIMLYSLTQTYSSDNTTDTNTMSGRWNKYFIKYDCCAVNQVIGTSNDFDTTPWCTTSGSCQQANSQIPKTCCKAVTEDDYQNAHDSCHSIVQPGSFKDSCFTKLTSLGEKTIDTYQIHVLCVLVFTLAIMKLIASILAGCIFIMTIPFLEKLKSCGSRKNTTCSKECDTNEESG